MDVLSPHVECARDKHSVLMFSKYEVTCEKFSYFNTEWKRKQCDFYYLHKNQGAGGEKLVSQVVSGW